MHARLLIAMILAILAQPSHTLQQTSQWSFVLPELRELRLIVRNHTQAQPLRRIARTDSWRLPESFTDAHLWG